MGMRSDLGSLNKRSNGGSLLHKPYSFPPCEAWEGNDGTWSTFLLRVGTPEQTFRVLISTQSQETWVPVPQGCRTIDLPNCGDLRGAQPFQSSPSIGFNSTLSSSWQQVGLYELGVGKNLNYTGNGLYGYETIGLELPNSGGISLEHQVIAGAPTKDFMFGYFPLGPKPTNFSDFNTPQLSYIESLKNQSHIPSLSYGYTAGASYRGPGGTLASLTLGGYDAARFTPNNYTWAFPTSDRWLTVALQGIVASNSLIGVAQMMPRGIFTLIDSTVPEIWLPIEACTIFESAFGLQYDNVTHRYLVNETVHAKLQELKPILSFKLANETSGGEFITIDLPYSAFDLQASWPIYANKTNYFPLRRAANSTQYTLGRSFLQEVYITVDYERSKFSVAQTIFPAPPSQILAIDPVIDTTQTKKGLSPGAIAGIVIGIVLTLVILLTLAFFLYKRKQRKRHKTTSKPTDENSDTQETSEPSTYAGTNMPVTPADEEREEISAGDPAPKYEVDGTIPVQEVHAVHVSELDGGFFGHEVSDRPRTAELEAGEWRTELSGECIDYCRAGDKKE